MSDQAFALLVDIAERSRRSAQGLPAQIDIKPFWTGIGFKMAGQRFVAPMGEVAEILHVPSATHLPGVHDWVKGVANVRGKLLPLIDMDAFWNGSACGGGRKQNRVLVLESGELFTGLIVEQVYGMQHFPTDCLKESAEKCPEVVRPYVNGAFLRDNQEWSIFSPFRLAQDGRFANAAAA